MPPDAPASRILSQQEIVEYLLRRDLISPQAIVEEGLTIIDMSRRNRNVQVVRERGPSYLLKQALTPDAVFTLRNEASLYDMFWSGQGHDRLCAFLPQYHAYDQAQDVLVLELVPNAKTLREVHSARRQFSKTLAARLGEALAALHTDDNARASVANRELKLPTGAPWPFSLHRPSPAVFKDVSSANVQLVKTLQQFADFGSHLDELRNAYQPTSLIHGDVKWDNCLAVPANGSGRRTQLKLVDWELSSLGDPCWDVGAVFSEYLSFWVSSIPITGTDPPEEFIQLARFPLERTQPAMRSFWHAYERGIGLDRAASIERLVRSVRFCAVRLIQTSFEQLQMSTQLTGNIVSLLQLTLNMLRRPEEAAVHLLGFTNRE